MLVDTTVWVDLFRNRDTAEVRKLVQFLNQGEDICTCGVILTEVLQGIPDDRAYKRTLRAFENLISLPMTQSTFIRSADVFRRLRKKGLTIRNSVDCMIAAVAIEHDVPLLHYDRDFDAIATLGELRFK